MARKREFNVFSLSFLDIMSCGFGAVILIFIVIHHGSEASSQELSVALMSEVVKLEEQVDTGTDRLVQLRNSVEETDDEIITTEELTLKIIREIQELQARIAELSEASKTEAIEQLKEDLKRLQQETEALEISVDSGGTSLRSFVGQGDRQYLTGINLGGSRILVLLDKSASMYHETIVNTILLRNLKDDDPRKVNAPKWRRAVRTVEWILANLPPGAQFQVLTFNTEAGSVIAADDGDWLDATDKAVDDVMQGLNAMLPEGGTSLYSAFVAARELDPRPDNIFLIVDGLPTQGESLDDRARVTSKQRVQYFSEAFQMIPVESSVNIILFPMEGDPLAAPLYWQMAQQTTGSLLTPTEDWP